MVGEVFQPGFVCYGIPMGTDGYVASALWEKAEDVAREVEKVTSILSEDSQALWVAVHRSLAHKMDYHLSLCYPTDILPVAEHLDTILWAAFERAVGQHVPRRHEGLGTECMLDIPVDSMRGRSFQEHAVRLPIRLRGFGLRSLRDTSPAAFIGGVEMALGGEEAEGGWWRALMEEGSRTGDEYGSSWAAVQREGEQLATFLNVELTGTLANGADSVENLPEGGSCRQAITEQREVLREAAVAEGLRVHGDKAARPVLMYPQLDKLSAAWKLSLPGPTSGLTSTVFKEVMAQALCLPSLACSSIVGQTVGYRGATVGVFGDELVCALGLSQDTWRTRHDELKVVLVNIANQARLPIECEVFGLFRDLIPAVLVEEGGELQYGRQRLGLCPDFKLRLPTLEGPQDCLGEFKFISAGVSRYPEGRRTKACDVRAGELPGTYRRPLERLDRLHHGTQPGETGPLVQRLNSYGRLQGYVAGNWGEGSQDLHSYIQTCAEARVAHLTRASGRQETERLLGTIVGQFRRLVSTTIVRAQAMCLITRVSLITPAAREAAVRRQISVRMEAQLRNERRAQWMASLQGPGWARRGNCHTIL